MAMDCLLPSPSRPNERDLDRQAAHLLSLAVWTLQGWKAVPCARGYAEGSRERWPSWAGARAPTPLLLLSLCVCGSLQHLPLEASGPPPGVGTERPGATRAPHAAPLWSLPAPLLPSSLFETSF